MATGNLPSPYLTLPEAIAQCVDGLGRYRALREELFRLRLAHRGLPGGPWRPRYKRDPKEGDPTLPPKITHDTGTISIEGWEFEGVAYITQPETYAPFHDLELIDANNQPAPEGSEASKATLSLWFVLSNLLNAVKAIVGSVVYIERQAKALHLKTDTTSLSQLLVHLPVFPYWPRGTGLKKEDFDKVLADERPIIEAAQLALHRLALETNTATVARPRVTAERLRSRLDEIADNFRHLQSQQPSAPLVSSRKPDDGIVTVAGDVAFKAMAHSAGDLLMAFPPHWRFGVTEKTEALPDPAERWVGAVLDLAFAGVIELATWNGIDHVEVLEDSVGASLLAIQGIIENSKRPNKGKGTYIAQKEMVKADVEKEAAKLSGERRPDLAALYLYVSSAVSHAARIVRMSRVSTTSPSAFIGSFVRLDHWLERLAGIADLPALLSQWPEEPRGFTWGRKTRPSALERGIVFAKSIHTAAAIARSIHRMPSNDSYWDEQPVANAPGEGIVRWAELAMRELREMTIPLSYVWPSIGDVDEDAGRIAYAMEAEYRRAVAGVESSGGSNVESPAEEALRVIYEMGQQMERYRTFRGLGEETLRGAFASALGLSAFTVTAESLNGDGKTDILVSRGNTTVLVGECKFWGGQKKYFETIDQLSGYVIHRNPRAVILLFVDGKDLPLVVSQVEQKTSDHPLWCRTHGEMRKNWHDFELKKSPGSAQTTRVSIMCFHFPHGG